MPSQASDYPVTQVRVPGDTEPSIASADPSPRAAATTVDEILLAATRRATDATTTEQEEFLPFRLKYQTFIAQAFVPTPDPRDDLYYNGNDRGFNTFDTFEGFDKSKSDVTATVYFGDEARVDWSKDLGVTQLYRRLGSGAYEPIGEPRQEEDNRIVVIPQASGPTSAVFTVIHEATNPFPPLDVPVLDEIESPPISYEATLVLVPDGSGIVGRHDRTPHHEIHGGPFPGQYVSLYQQPIHPRFGFSCLP